MQAFFNIFDNALEASPNFIAIEAVITKNNFIVSVEDQGKGFDQDLIKEIGKANLSSKNSSGLGLFLALNALQNISGDLKFENLVTIGAKVSITIPLKNL